jgi:hypothetical protein
VKSVQKIARCYLDHPMTHVFVAGLGMRLFCACSDYKPINAATPYLSIKAPEPIGKAGWPRNKGGCYPQGSKP